MDDDLALVLVVDDVGVSLLLAFKSGLAAASWFLAATGDESFGLRYALTPGGGSLIVN